MARGSRAALAVTSVVAAGCSSSTNATGEATTGDDAAVSDPIDGSRTPTEGGKAVFGVVADSPGWNPHDNQWAQHSSMVGSSFLEPLAALDADLNPVPWLATAWTPNDSFDSWTIDLREGVTFHNGEAFDAAAVKRNIDDLGTAALTGLIWKPVFTGTTVIDADTVQIDLNAPFAAFPTSFLASQTAFMMAPEALDSPERGIAEPIGTGPFELQAWVKGSSVTVVKNESYWQEGLPHLDEIEFQVLGDASAMATALQADDIDLAFTPAMATVTQVPEDFTIVKDWGSEPGMAITNTLPEVNGAPNPMANEHARKALAYATDQQALADLIGPGVELPSSPFSPDSKWGMPKEDNGYVTFDLEKAKQEVAAYDAESDIPLSVILSASAGTDTEGVVQLLQNQWGEAGIELKIESLEATAFISNVVGGKYQVALFNIYGAPDPDQNHHFWSAGNANGPDAISINFTQFTTPVMEENLEIGRASGDEATRKAAYDKIVTEINGAAVNIWTYSIPYSIVATPRVGGLTTASEVPFGNYQPKTWLGELWLDI